ncbi:MAG: hypothetical protein R6U32_05495 [Candidatus Woesearchaeota archaeon]
MPESPKSADKGDEPRDGREARKIVIDTNFLLIPPKFRLDIFHEIDKTVNFKYQLIILSRSLEELKNIVSKPKGNSARGADREAAKTALELLEAKRESLGDKLRVVGSEGHVDDTIVEMASHDKRMIVATQDKELKRRLKEQGNSVMVMKQKKYLEIEG